MFLIIKTLLKTLFKYKYSDIQHIVLNTLYTTIYGGAKGTRNPMSEDDRF